MLHEKVKVFPDSTFIGELKFIETEVPISIASPKAPDAVVPSVKSYTALVEVGPSPKSVLKVNEGCFKGAGLITTISLSTKSLLYMTE